MKIPAIYKDEFGEVETEIFNDFKQLTVTIGQVTFVSCNFDDFTPVDSTEIDLPTRFKLNNWGSLTDCSLLCRIPIAVTKNDKDTTAILIVNTHIKSQPNPAENTYNTL